MMSAKDNLGSIPLGYSKVLRYVLLSGSEVFPSLFIESERVDFGRSGNTAFSPPNTTAGPNKGGIKTSQELMETSSGNGVVEIVFKKVEE